MAIAYFIPDQAKLLAASSNTNSSSQTNTNNVNSSSTNNHATSTGSTQSHTPTTNSTNGAHSHHGSGGGGSVNHSNNFRANITIPLSAYSATAAQSDVGCWDLLTQIFCHALRFCHQTERHPAVIQISLEISSSGPNGDTTAQVGAAPMQQTQQQEQGQQQAQQENLTAAHVNSPPQIAHPTVGPQSTAHTQLQHNVSAADSSERPTTTAPLAASAESLATATLSSRDLEPGTHKPSAKSNKDNF